MIINVASNEDLKVYTDSSKYCLVAFHELAGESCMMMDPFLEYFSMVFPSIIIYKVDIDLLGDAANLFGVSTTPTYFIVAWGQVYNQLVGGDKDKLEALLKVYNGQQPPPNPRKGNVIDKLFTETNW